MKQIAINNNLFRVNKLTVKSLIVVLTLSIGIIPLASSAGFFDSSPNRGVGDSIPSLAPMIEQTSPAVVQITVKGKRKVKQHLLPLR